MRQLLLLSKPKRPPQRSRVETVRLEFAIGSIYSIFPGTRNGIFFHLVSILVYHFLHG